MFVEIDAIESGRGVQTAVGTFDFMIPMIQRNAFEVNNFSVGTEFEQVLPIHYQQVKDLRIQWQWPDGELMLPTTSLTETFEEVYDDFNGAEHQLLLEFGSHATAGAAASGGGPVKRARGN
jgi:hypothetical protein